jgi:hypothetical protein
LRIVDSLHILFEVLVFFLDFVSLFDMGRHLHWIFVDLLLQCQVPRTTPCLLSLLSHPISRHLIYAHEFKVFVKTTSVFENFQVFLFWRSRPEYPPPWAEYPVGPDYPGHSGWIIRPCGDWVYKGQGRAALGKFLPHPVQRFPAAAAAAFSSPPPELRPPPWPDFAGGCSPPPLEGIHLADFAMDAGILLSLGCDLPLHMLGDLAL